MAQGIVVPAFFPLGCTYTNTSGVQSGCWAELEAVGGSGAAGPATVRLAVAEASFPDLATNNPEEADRARFVFDLCRYIYDIRILGYVSTRSGNRPTQEIKNDIQKWYTTYPANIDGMFFDEGPVHDNASEPFYTQLFSEYKSEHPGQLVFLNAAQYPLEWVMGVAHYVNLWEEELPVYNDPNRYGALALDANGNEINIGAPAWWTYPQYTDRVSHIVYNCPNTQEMRDAINLSRQRRVGNIYVFDGTSNAYNKLPAYWKEEVAHAKTP